MQFFGTNVWFSAETVIRHTMTFSLGSLIKSPPCSREPRQLQGCTSPSCLWALFAQRETSITLSLVHNGWKREMLPCSLVVKGIVQGGTRIWAKSDGRVTMSHSINSWERERENECVSVWERGGAGVEQAGHYIMLGKYSHLKCSKPGSDFNPNWRDWESIK